MHPFALEPGPHESDTVYLMSPAKGRMWGQIVQELMIMEELHFVDFKKWSAGFRNSA